LWNEVGASLRITVEPPYWATWWFRLLVASAIAALVVLVVRARMRSVRMKAELHAAHDAQMAIMPQTEVEVPGFEISGLCRPAHEVGGDFFDVFWADRDGEKLCVVVGDAAGKAMNAAMTAVMSDGMVVSRSHQPGSVADIMGCLNRTLHSKVPKRMFTALSLLVLDPATRSIELANAGLCDPLLKTGRGVEELSISGARYPLGRFADTAYLSRTVVLEPGDVVVAFTDGLPEARTRSGDLYGYEAPRQALQLLDTDGMSAAEIVEAMLDDVRRCCGGARQRDDLTIVVIAARAAS
jgi:sigma-B regulation protein RsbU (phosphoserine phosphatase)